MDGRQDKATIQLQESTGGSNSETPLRTPSAGPGSPGDPGLCRGLHILCGCQGAWALPTPVRARSAPDAWLAPHSAPLPEPRADPQGCPRRSRVRPSPHCCLPPWQAEATAQASLRPRGHASSDDSFFPGSPPGTTAGLLAQGKRASAGPGLAPAFSRPQFSARGSVRALRLLLLLCKAAERPALSLMLCL